MRNFMLYAVAFMLISFMAVPDTISKKERSQAIKLLKNTQKDVLSEIDNLTEAQLKYKPAPDRWSVEECVKHIAVTEQALWQLTEGTLKQAANPDKRSDIKTSDEQLIKTIENRTRKVQTSEKLKPENTPFASTEDALESFKTSRNKLIEYVKTTGDDLRNHVATIPIGAVDCYQMILFIAGHSNRHTQQIKEVKADPNFPKN